MPILHRPIALCGKSPSLYSALSCPWTRPASGKLTLTPKISRRQRIRSRRIPVPRVIQVALMGRPAITDEASGAAGPERPDRRRVGLTGLMGMERGMRWTTRDVRSVAPGQPQVGASMPPTGWAQRFTPGGMKFFDLSLLANGVACPGPVRVPRVRPHLGQLGPGRAPRLYRQARQGQGPRQAGAIPERPSRTRPGLNGLLQIGFHLSFPGWGRATERCRSVSHLFRPRPRGEISWRSW